MTAPQHPTIAEELEAVNNQSSNHESMISDVDRDRSLISGGLTTIIEHQATTSHEDIHNSNGLSEIHPFKETSRSRSASLGQRSPTITPYSPILERSESLSSQEKIEINSDENNESSSRKEEPKPGRAKPLDRRDLYKRMASDTDLWMSIKSRPSKFQSNLEATKEIHDSRSAKPSMFYSKNFIIVSICNWMGYHFTFLKS